MPLSVNDPYYVAEDVPSAISAMSRPLCSAYGVGAAAFGAKGNTVHQSGYHRSRQWVLNSPDSRYGSGDYSVTQTLDKSGDQRWISAFDFTPGSWGTQDNRMKMRQITNRVYNAAKARDPRLANLREFAGTLNGTSVITFNCADGSLKSPFDSSHLDHCHGSFWRSRANNNHTGIIEVMLGTPQGVFMALSDAQQNDLWEWLALLVDPGTPDTGRVGDRFHFPPSLFHMKKMIEQQSAVLALIASKVDIDPEELLAITAAAKAGAVAASEDIVAGVLAGIQQGADLTPTQMEQVEQAVRNAFAGGLAEG